MECGTVGGCRWLCVLGSFIVVLYIYNVFPYQFFISCFNCRYIRVFPDGIMLMHNTPEEPQVTVGKLKHRNCPLPGVMVGRYRLVSDIVS